MAEVFQKGGYPLALVALAAALALAMPDSWTAPSGPVRTLMLMIINLVPSIEKYASISDYPEFAQTLLALLWGASPLLVVVHFWLLRATGGIARFSSATDPRSNDFKRLLSIYASVFIVLSLIVVVPYVAGPGDPSVLLRDSRGAALLRVISKSKLAFSIFAALLLWLWSLGIAILGLVVLNITRFSFAHKDKGRIK